MVVESPVKARTIGGYLGRDYRVIATRGHVRDLPAKAGSVKPGDGFAIVYETGKRAARTLGALAKALAKAETLVLATDPDREGEAIAWQVLEWLTERDAVGDVPVHRVAFHEVTPAAVRTALSRPRDIDMDLVRAWQARRALDYLVGYGLSPLLWRKLPGCRSAGRVQSVALRLVCEREAEIEAFAPRHYRTVHAELAAADGAAFPATLVRLDGKEIGEAGLATTGTAEDAAARIGEARLAVLSVERDTLRRRPLPPFTTATLQQEAARRLGFGIGETMEIAQRLYEGVDLGGETAGLITYMRTDSTAMAKTAVAQARAVARKRFGDAYVPAKPRAHRARDRQAPPCPGGARGDPADRLRAGAGSARGAARPRGGAALRADPEPRPGEPDGGGPVRPGADPDRPGNRGYGGRSPAGGGGHVDGLRRPSPGLGRGRGEGRRRRPRPAGTGGRRSRIGGRGAGGAPCHAAAAALHRGGAGAPAGRARHRPALDLGGDRRGAAGARLRDPARPALRADRTRPGRDRVPGGVLRRLGGDRLHGGDGGGPRPHRRRRARLARDAGGVLGRLPCGARDGRRAGADDGAGGGRGAPRRVPVRRRCRPAALPGLPRRHRLELRLSRYGPFVGCADYPACGYRRGLAAAADAGEGYTGPRDLGIDPGSGLPVTLRRGPNGWYVQRGERTDTGGGAKPARMSLPGSMAPGSVDLDLAQRLLALPREVGMHPESGQPILAGIGRYGPWLRHEETYAAIPADEDVLAIGLNRAVDLIADKQVRESRARGPKQVLRKLGPHPDDGAPVWLKTGHYGPFVAHRRRYASLPEDLSEDALTLERAVELLDR